jgi:hypothetical protein
MGRLPEGHDFWSDIIYLKKFTVFYERYPKEATINVSTPSEKY